MLGHFNIKGSFFVVVLSVFLFLQNGIWFTVKVFSLVSLRIPKVVFLKFSSSLVVSYVGLSFLSKGRCLVSSDLRVGAKKLVVSSEDLGGFCGCRVRRGETC